jgi:Uncharacterized conserved protein
MNAKKMTLLILVFLCVLTACNILYFRNQSKGSTNSQQEEQVQSEDYKVYSNMIDLNIIIGEQILPAKFYVNDATNVLIEKMPFTITMSDFNSNEKLYHLPESLPIVNSEVPSTIHEGEIMCWNANTLVLFYETFSNSFGGYTRLGYIEDPSGLRDMVGLSDVEVTFELN